MSGTRVAPRAGRLAQSQPGPARRRLAAALGIAAAAVVLFACYLRQSRTVAVGSDGASQALQAWDMLHGNLLLHGWWVTDVSFYTTELPQYALVEAARGLTSDVIHVAGALTYTLLVLAAALLARGGTSGRPGVARALLAAGIMLAPQLTGGTQTLVLSPDHTGTGVPVLALFLLIDRAPPRWYVPVLVWAGLAATALADAITLFIAFIPLAAVGALYAIRQREQRWYPAALGAAAVLAVPAELAVAALLRALGGWQVNGLATGLAGIGQLAGNARLTGEGLLTLFGADFLSTPPGVQTVLAVVHLAGVLLAVAGVGAVARRFPFRCGLVPAVLLAGITLDLAAYLAGVQAVNLLSTREIAPVLPFAAVLAGRLAGDRLTSAGRTAGRNTAVAVLVVYACGLGYAAAQPPAAPQYAGLAAWLRAHHLASGLSGYHQANIVTLETGGAVTLRPLAPEPPGRPGRAGRAARAGQTAPLAGYAWNSSAGWFDPARHTATFVVAAAPGQPASAGPSVTQATATFGPPARTYRYETYVILVWPQGVNLLDHLAVK